MPKGQIISKCLFVVFNFFQKRTNEFVFTTMRRVFVCFLEEIEDTKKTFRNYLTFRHLLPLFENVYLWGKAIF